MRPACLGVRAELSLTWRLQTRQGQESSLRVPPHHTPLNVIPAVQGTEGSRAQGWGGTAELVTEGQRHEDKFSEALFHSVAKAGARWGRPSHAQPH